jgi:serine/threonine protein kinase
MRRDALEVVSEQLEYLQQTGESRIFNSGSGFLLNAARQLGVAAKPDLPELGLEDLQIEDLYHIGAQLGRGCSAIVNEVELKGGSTGHVAALKTISKQSEWWLGGDLDRRRDTTFREVSLLQRMAQHKCRAVTKMFAVIETQRCVYILMELCSGGDLMQHMVKLQKVLPENKCAYLCRYVAQSLSDMHKLGIIHRDLKLENILLKSAEDLAETRITDFGLSNSFKNVMLTSFVGTRNFMAPEMLQKNRQYDNKVDMWGLGTVIYTMLSSKVPFFCTGEVSTSEFLELVQAGPEFVPADWGGITAEGRAVVECLLCADPEKRMTADQFLHTEWLEKLSAQYEDEVARQSQRAIGGGGGGGLLRMLFGPCLPKRHAARVGAAAPISSAPRGLGATNSVKPSHLRVMSDDGFTTKSFDEIRRANLAKQNRQPSSDSSSDDVSGSGSRPESESSSQAGSVRRPEQNVWDMNRSSTFNSSQDLGSLATDSNGWKSVIESNGTSTDGEATANPVAGRRNFQPVSPSQHSV